jgi:hypothetical protein
MWKLVDSHARRLPIDRWLKIFITAPTAVVSPSYRTQTHNNLQIWMMYWPSVGDASFMCYDGTKFGYGRDAIFNWFLLVIVRTKQKKAKKSPGPQRVKEFDSFFCDADLVSHPSQPARYATRVERTLNRPLLPHVPIKHPVLGQSMRHSRPGGIPPFTGWLSKNLPPISRAIKKPLLRCHHTMITPPPPLPLPSQ